MAHSGTVADTPAWIRGCILPRAHCCHASNPHLHLSKKFPSKIPSHNLFLSIRGRVMHWKICCFAFQDRWISGYLIFSPDSMACLPISHFVLLFYLLIILFLSTQVLPITDPQIILELWSHQLFINFQWHVTFCSFPRKPFPLCFLYFVFFFLFDQVLFCLVALNLCKFSSLFCTSAGVPLFFSICYPWQDAKKTAVYTEQELCCKCQLGSVVFAWHTTAVWQKFCWNRAVCVLVKAGRQGADKGNTAAECHSWCWISHLLFTLV